MIYVAAIIPTGVVATDHPRCIVNGTVFDYFGQKYFNLKKETLESMDIKYNADVVKHVNPILHDEHSKTIDEKIEFIKKAFLRAAKPSKTFTKKDMMVDNFSYHFNTPTHSYPNYTQSYAGIIGYSVIAYIDFPGNEFKQYWKLVQKLAQYAIPVHSFHLDEKQRKLLEKQFMKGKQEQVNLYDPRWYMTEEEFNKYKNMMNQFDSVLSSMNDAVLEQSEAIIAKEQEKYKDSEVTQDGV